MKLGLKHSKVFSSLGTKASDVGRIGLKHSGTIASGAELVEGIAGLPVFAGTPEKGMGIVYFTGPTMGYLIGFLAAVYLTGFFTFDNNFFKNFAKLLFSVSFIYLLGLIWLGSLIGWDKPIFKLGAQPFLLAELFKISLLALLIPAILKFRKL